LKSVDYELDAEQEQLRDAVGTLLSRRAGPARARSVGDTGGVDQELASALAGAGFLDLFAEGEAGPLEAELVVEWVAAAAGVLPIGARCLVAPSVIDTDLPATVTVMEEHASNPVRFGGTSEAILVIGDSEARLVTAAPGATEPVPSLYGYPLSRVSLAEATVVGTGDPNVARRWWQVALAAEMAGTMGAAFALTLEYQKNRKQFDRPIGSFQSLQHRMSQLYVRQQGSAWLAREAAFHGAPAEAAAAAAAYAAESAAKACVELHQMTGAIGFTREYDLHIWSLRLQALRLEMSGLRTHALALARARWA